MAFETWLAFAAASAVLLAIPGPTILLVVAYALGAGRRTALWTVAGVFFGDLLAITLSVLGLGVILATSATLFTALKWIGLNIQVRKKMSFVVTQSSGKRYRSDRDRKLEVLKYRL